MLSERRAAVAAPCVCASNFFAGQPVWLLQGTLTRRPEDESTADVGVSPGKVKRMFLRPRKEVPGTRARRGPARTMRRRRHRLAPAARRGGRRFCQTVAGSWGGAATAARAECPVPVTDARPQAASRGATAIPRPIPSFRKRRLFDHPHRAVGGAGGEGGVGPQRRGDLALARFARLPAGLAFAAMRRGAPVRPRRPPAGWCGSGCRSRSGRPPRRGR